VTLDRASAPALDEAGRTLRELSVARQVSALYQPGHPTRREAARELLASVRRLQDLVTGPLIVFIGRKGFYLGPTLLPRASLTYFGLLEAFEEIGIEAIEILPTVDEHDLTVLVSMLTGEADSSSRLRGVVINGVRPISEEGGDESRMKELLRTYASGVQFLQETAQRVAAGHPASIEKAGGVSSRLAEQVVADPAQALLLTTVKSYDEYTYYHMVNVCILSIAIGQAIGLRRDQVVALGAGGLLHDVGKVKVPREILQQAGPLSEEQWRLIQRHPVDGVGLLLSSGRDIYHPALSMILEHHAAFDRTGYPSLSGQRMPSLPARIVAVADCFDALTSRRQYRKAEERRQALGILQAAAGRGYDPRVVRIFVRLLGLFPIGSLVRLTSGEVGVVVRNHESLPVRPLVRLVLDAHGNPVDAAEAEELDLSTEAPSGGYTRSVERSVDPRDIDLDMLALLSSGQFEPLAKDEGPGLVHEPAYGEAPPPGYVDTHRDEPVPEIAGLAPSDLRG
jgi:HD-GYP domain-containing protein (c-di-GMP phosphodiesterase class II)